MTIYLGLGSNQGDRRANLEKAANHLASSGFEISKVSPVVETPALLPAKAKPSWNKPFLNCVIAGIANWQPKKALETVKGIEIALGRKNSKKWAPRTIDIDLLIWHEEIVREKSLTIPHAAATERAFVLTPLLHLQPDLVIPGQKQTVFDLCRVIKPIPLWMGILNVTPDSFSGGGLLGNEDELISQVDAMVDENVHFVDIGAESTRPNAKAVTPAEEWRRLEPVLTMLSHKFQHRTLGPVLSIDSRHRINLEKALNLGAGVINDVTGLRDPEIIDLAKERGCQVVAMHSMSVPVNPEVILPDDKPAVKQLQHWLEKRINLWLDSGLDLNNIIFDPGIGFGKSPLQSLELLKQCQELKNSGLRLLIGHSRKSFMSGFTERPFGERDLETLGISLGLCQKGVDIVRVHDAVMHLRAYRGWSHIQSP